jgi:tripartite-type tricarboxylate transporter receptor subunit TctC
MVTRRWRNTVQGLSASALAAVAALLGLTTHGAAAAAPADTFPSRSIRLVVPFPPAGATDILARAVANDLQKTWGQSVVVENRPGAGGNLGADQVAKANPDGYTLVMGTVGTHGINVSLYARMPYDAIRDFAPVTLVAAVPNLLVVHPSVPVTSVRELIDLARAQPGILNYASSGNGTSIHLSGELFKSMANVQITHVPFNGSGPAIGALVAGQVQAMFDNMPSALPQAKSGRLRPLAVTSAHRSPALPEIPTIAEAGLPGYDASSWFGVLAPAGTPRDIVAKLNAAIVRGLQSSETRDRLSGQGAEPVGDSPEHFAEFIRAEIAKWAGVVKAAGARVD